MRKARATGLALIILGAVFIATTSRAGRVSAAGLIAGVLFVAAGLVRIVRARDEGPPAA